VIRKTPHCLISRRHQQVGSQAPPIGIRDTLSIGNGEGGAGKQEEKRRDKKKREDDTPEIHWRAVCLPKGRREGPVVDSQLQASRWPFGVPTTFRPTNAISSSVTWAMAFQILLFENIPFLKEKKSCINTVQFQKPGMAEMQGEP
jgi:hypothetical protein